MSRKPFFTAIMLATSFTTLIAAPAFAQVGTRFPSEKKIVPDPITGVPLTFLTTGPSSDAKLYQTHQPWTADGKWVIFRSSDRIANSTTGQAFAVNEESGVIVQLTEGPTSSTSALNVARKSMKLYYTRYVGQGATGVTTMYELNLETLLKDSEAKTLKPADQYERIVGKLPPGMRESGGFGLDANEDFAYIGVSGAGVGDKIPTDLKVAPNPPGARLGTGPGGLRSINLKTGEVAHIIDVPFQMGHVQTNPFVTKEIIYCWETGGKAPQRTWTVLADGTGNRPLYPESDYEWVTHEAVITKDEVAMSIMGHVTRTVAPGAATTNPYVEAGTRDHPTGLAVVNLRTHQMRIEAQTPAGSSGLWHVNGSYDGRFLIGDDWIGQIYSDYLIDRHTGEMITLTTGHPRSAADHTHPIFSPDGTRILIQSAMLATDKKALDIVVVPVPKSWLDRKYTAKVGE